LRGGLHGHNSAESEDRQAGTEQRSDEGIHMGHSISLDEREWRNEQGYQSFVTIPLLFFAPLAHFAVKGFSSEC
jgi:hypothetical protein